MLGSAPKITRKEKAMPEKNSLTEKFESFIKIDEQGQTYLNVEEAHSFFNHMLANVSATETPQIFANENFGFVKFCREHKFPINLSGLDLSGLDFTGADFQGANFEGSRFIGTNFTGAKLEDSNFNKASLTDANLQNTNIKSAEFNEANLTNANLSNAKVVITQFKNANLTNAKLNNWKKPNDPDFTGAILRGAQMRGINPKKIEGLGGILFTSADLTDADLSGSNLFGSIFNDAILRGTNLSNCTLTRSEFMFADMSGADISGTKFIQQSFFRTIILGTKYNEETDSTKSKNESHVIDEERKISAMANIIAERTPLDEINQVTINFIPHLHRCMQGSRDINLQLATKTLERSFRYMLLPHAAKIEIGKNIETLATFMQCLRSKETVFSILPIFVIKNIAKHFISHRGQYPIADRILDEMIERNRPEKAGLPIEGQKRDLFLLSGKETSIFEKLKPAKKELSK